MRTPPPTWLRVLARLVPGGRRIEWVREWSAEIAHVRTRRSRSTAFSLHLAVLEDALTLRARTLTQGSIRMDVRYALRSLLRQSGFTVVVVLTLGLGLGAAVTLFSAVHGIALRPLPYDAPGRVALVTTAFRGHFEIASFPASVPEYLELKAENPAFADLAAYQIGRSNVGGLEEPRRVTVASATANVLDVLGVAVEVGRGFVAGEDRPSAERVAVLTHGMWRESWGGDPGAIGQTLRIDGTAHTIIGVLPAGFEFPGAEPDLLRAVRIDPANPGDRSSHWLSMVARLRDGTDVEAARAETRSLLERWQAEAPDRHGLTVEGHPVSITGVREAMVGDMRRPLQVMSAAVFLVLLVACLNVANLLLVRGEDRRHEFGVRAALGAGRGALVRQLLMESGALAVAGGLLGLGLAAAALSILPELARGSLPPNTHLALDEPVLIASGMLVAAVAVAFGLIPAFAAKGDAAATLAGVDVKSTSGRRRLALRRGLVVAEVAAAVVLIAGAGILGRSFGALLTVDVGLDVDRVALFDLELNPSSYPEIADVAAFHRELKERAEALPSVEAVGSIRTVPLAGGGGLEFVDVLGETPPAEGDGRNWNVLYQLVDPGLFEALGVAPVSGRGVEPRDVAGAAPIVVVNETAVRALWGPDTNPLGREIRLGGMEGNTNPVLRVVGVVADTRQSGLDRDPPPQIFVPRAQAAAIYNGLGARFATVVVRASGDPGAILPVMRDMVREMDPELPFASPRTLHEQVARSVGDRRLLVVLMGSFSAVAALLGAVGLYGLMAYVVRRRSREFGIRYVLGAARRTVVGGVMIEAAGLLTLGSAMGVALAVVSSGMLDDLVYGIGTRDPLALIGAPVLLILVGLVAAWLPARRASAVDPALVLREE
jgi:putative ABC transport system permease protein